MFRFAGRLRLAPWLLPTLMLVSGCELQSQRRSARSYPQAGAYPPGAYPPGAYPPGAYPPGAYPPGAYPPGAYPPGAYPPGAYPPGAYPPPSYPPGTATPGVTPITPSPGAAPGSRVQWQAVAPTNSNVNLTWGPTLTDIMQRKPLRETGQWDDVAGTAHELTHSISFELRLVASRTRLANGFYVLGGQAAVIAEPQGFRKSQVAGLVPPSLRQTRFELYMAGQTGWDNRPLYVWDEWNAYINGCSVAVERYQLGLEPHKTFATSDEVFAVLEFTIYALAVIHAAQQYEPAYLTQEPQAREFFAYNARRAMALVNRGRNLPPFKWAALATVEATLRSAPEAEPLRASARSIFGPAWAREVFGF